MKNCYKRYHDPRSLQQIVCNGEYRYKIWSKFWGLSLLCEADTLWFTNLTSFSVLLSSKRNMTSNKNLELTISQAFVKLEECIHFLSHHHSVKSQLRLQRTLRSPGTAFLQFLSISYYLRNPLQWHLSFKTSTQHFLDLPFWPGFGGGDMIRQLVISVKRDWTSVGDSLAAFLLCHGHDTNIFSLQNK